MVEDDEPEPQTLSAKMRSGMWTVLANRVLAVTEDTGGGSVSLGRCNVMQRGCKGCGYG